LIQQEEFAEEVKRTLIPNIIKAQLEGNTSALKPWLGEGVYNKLAADIRTRKHDGIKFDSTILDIDENQIVMRFLENGGAVIAVVYMVQLINCIRNRKDEIIEVQNAIFIFIFIF
jgi:mitochondrial import inner membrane translocase subunit TIM44